MYVQIQQQNSAKFGYFKRYSGAPVEYVRNNVVLIHHLRSLRKYYGE
jgi:hypothetical protein